MIDVRPRGEYANGHVAGTLNVESDGAVATYLGWMLPTIRTPLAFVAAHHHQVAAAQRDLARIGVDDLRGAAVGPVPADRQYRVASFADLAEAVRSDDPPTVLDVRRDEEVADGALVGSVHIPLPDLPSRSGRLPAGPIWVHCASGFRASIAASLLDRDGHEVVLVDGAFGEALDRLRQDGLISA